MAAKSKKDLQVKDAKREKKRELAATPIVEAPKKPGRKPKQDQEPVIAFAEKPKRVNYINNAEFYSNFKEYYDKRQEALATGQKPPKVPNSLAIAFALIAKKLASKANFCRYTFRDEMEADAIVSCVHYTNNFNPYKSTNPFSYFTQVCFCAFLRRIDLEKKEYYVRAKGFQQAVILQQTYSLDHGEGFVDQQEEHIGNFDNMQVNNDGVNHVIEQFESKRRAKLLKKNAEKAPKIKPTSMVAVEFEKNLFN